MPFPDGFFSSEAESLFLRRLLDHVSDCLIAVDTEGLIVLVNAPYCRLLGGTPSDFIGRHVTEVVSPQTRLHLVARGAPPVAGGLLEVRGHRMITRQVPVYEGGRIVGAIGMALFPTISALKKVARLADPELSLPGAHSGWRTQFGLEDLLGAGAQFEALRARLRRAAAHAQPVLIEGESGTGKELAAQALHGLGPRAQRPFVWVNCASIPENLIDAELFGYEGGAFTGARTRGKPGKFELAHGGTLFLDEIGDMPLHLQASLLRAVQTREIVRVGGTAPQAVDVRILCATHRPLATLVRSGRFRLDLYHRLNVSGIRLPALREREDLDLLSDQLLARIAQREGLAPRALQAAERARLRQHGWPGNVRELENTLLRFALEGEITIEPMDSLPRPCDAGEGTRLRQHLDGERLQLLRRTLAAVGGDKEEAARRLGISRATLYRELRRGA
jgi:transcriptional regulator with PAS, ATPase and Fis domain